MQEIFKLTEEKYKKIKGDLQYQKLYNRVSKSNALTEICGLSVRRGLPPTSGDFIYKASLMPSMLLSFDNTQSTMAALIMLKIWDERVNSMYHFCADFYVKTMARQIIAECMMLY